MQIVAGRIEEPLVVTHDLVIPDSVWMIGTIRTFDAKAREKVGVRMKEIAQHIAAAHGATADVSVTLGYGSTINDAALVGRLAPVLQRVSAGKAFESKTQSMAGEDFSRFANGAPGFFFNLSVTPPSVDLMGVASNHSPLFQADDNAMPVGVRAMANAALKLLVGGVPKRAQ